MRAYRLFPLLALLLAACSSTPNLGKLQAQQDPVQQAKGVKGVARYLAQEKLVDGDATRLETVRYAGSVFRKLDAAQATPAEATGRALLALSQRASALPSAYGQRLAREALLAQADAPAPWALPQLLTLLESGATVPARALQREALLRQLRRQPADWQPPADVARRARLAIGQLRLESAWSGEELALARRLVNAEGLAGDAPLLPSALVPLFADDLQWLSSRGAAAALAPAFVAFDARRDLLPAAQQPGFDDAFAQAAPEAFARLAGPRLAEGDSRGLLRLLEAARRAPAADWSRQLVAQQLAPRVAPGLRSSREPLEILGIAVTYAQSGEPARAALQALLAERELSADVRSAVLTALIATAAAPEPALEPLLLRLLADQAGTASPLLQDVLLAHAASRQVVASPEAVLRALGRYYRSLEDSQPVPVAALADTIMRGLAARPEAGINAGEASLLRDLLRLAPEPVLERLRAHLGELPAQSLYDAFFSGIAGALPDEAAARQRLLLSVAALFQGRFATLDDSARGRIASLYAQQVSGAASAAEALALAQAALALAGSDAEAGERLRSTLLRRLGETTPPAAWAGAGGWGAERSRYDMPPAAAARVAGWLGVIERRAAPALAAPVFGTPREVLLLPRGERYPVHEAGGLALAQLLVFDAAGQLAYWPDGGAEPGRLTGRASAGTARFEAGGRLDLGRLDAAAQLRIAREGLIVDGLHYGGQRTGGQLLLAGDFTRRTPFGIGEQAAAGRSGSSGSEGRHGNDGDAGQDSSRHGGRGLAAGHGSDGGSGGRGSDGARGEDGKARRILAERIEGSATGELLYDVLVLPDNQRFVLAERSLLRLASRGGDGGAGGQGGRGGKGGAGGRGGAGGDGYAGSPGRDGQAGNYCSYQGCNCNGSNGGNGGNGSAGGDGGRGGNGADGGRGGAGGNGGSGGRGGDVCILFAGDSSSRRHFLNHLQIDVAGGRAGAAGAGGSGGAAGAAGPGGYAGSGGAGGRGGYAGSSGSGSYSVVMGTTMVNMPMTCYSGISGSPGSSGRDGSRGASGESGSTGSSGSAGSSGAAGGKGRILVGSMPAGLLSADTLPTMTSTTSLCAAAEELAPSEAAVDVSGKSS